MKRMSTSYAIFLSVVLSFFFFAGFFVLYEGASALIEFAVSGIPSQLSFLSSIYHIILGYFAISLILLCIFVFVYAILDNQKWYRAEEKLANAGIKIARSRTMLFWQPLIYKLIINYLIDDRDYEKALEKTEELFGSNKRYLPYYYDYKISVFYNRGEYFIVWKTYDEALRVIKEEDLIKGGTSHAYAFSFIEAGRYDEAAKEYARLLQTCKKNRRLRRNKKVKGELMFGAALACYCRKDYAQAWEYISNADKMARKKTPLFFYTKAKVLEKLGKDEEAEKAFIQAKGLEEVAEKYGAISRIKKMLDEN